MTSVIEEGYRYGFLRTCIDQRFVASTREAFEKASGLRPADYWHEAYAGGAAVPPANTRGEEYEWLPWTTSRDRSSDHKEA